MYRSLVFLLGTAILAAFMAAVYYAPENAEVREEDTAYNLGPGEVQQDTVHPSLPGSDIVYEVDVRHGVIDVYVLEQEWATPTAGAGALDLSQPFSYRSDLSKTHVNGTYTFSILSDGKTSYIVLFDNGDNFYEGDAGEDGSEQARVRTTVRFLAEEERSLTLGYIATVPSILLVVVTLGRQYVRWQKGRKA